MAKKATATKKAPALGAADTAEMHEPTARQLAMLLIPKAKRERGRVRPHQANNICRSKVAWQRILVEEESKVADVMTSLQEQDELPRGPSLRSNPFWDEAVRALSWLPRSCFREVINSAPAALRESDGWISHDIRSRRCVCAVAPRCRKRRCVSLVARACSPV